VTRLSLFVVDTPALDEAWQGTAVCVLTVRRPRGRLAGLLGGAGADTMTPARALPPLGVATARRAYLALVEDLALAAVHDVPVEILRTLWPSLETQLAMAETAFPPELAGSRDLLVLPTPAPPAPPVGGGLAAAVHEALLPLLTRANVAGATLVAEIRS
jgi:hypothetical protein